ncbi:hypothetical protein TNCV_4475731 [Trichonephila clavipes]|nr:hypothetical protein TNCV_4475731 [Trichonephila clavipes]
MGTLETLNQVLGCDTLSRMQIFDWHRRFREGRESVEDGKRSKRSTDFSHHWKHRKGFCTGMMCQHIVFDMKTNLQMKLKVYCSLKKDTVKDGFQKYFDDLYKA